MIAGLPMYDLSGLETHQDRLWQAIGDSLRGVGVDAPLRLERGVPPMDLWTAPDLLLAQTCGYPLVKHLAGRVRVVATPRYRAAGCVGPGHRAMIVVRKDDRRDRLEQFPGARCALNDEASNTGMNLFRAEIAPLLGDGESFFSEVAVTGSHSASIDAVIEAACDIAAVDCVTFALLRRLDPSRLAKVRILARTSLSPGLPLISAAATPDDVVLALRNALTSVVGDPDLQPTLNALLIEGFSNVPVADYYEVLRAERTSVEHGYPTLR